MFQVRGIPQLHSFLWILNVLALSKDNIQEYITFDGGIIKANVRDISKNEELFNSVTTYQLHKLLISWFLNSNLPECRYRIFRKKKSLMNYQMIVLIYFKGIC